MCSVIKNKNSLTKKSINPARRILDCKINQTTQNILSTFEIVQFTFYTVYDWLRRTVLKTKKTKQKTKHK